MNHKHSRRDFLKALALTLSSYGYLTASSDSPAIARGKLKIHDWTGDDFAVGHRLRNGTVPNLEKPDQVVKKEFVIVGGGLAGLTSAYYLKDHDFLLLEQYSEFGGNSRGGSFKGIDYSYGAAYYADNEGDLGVLVDKLGLKPVEIESDKNAWLWKKKWIGDSSEKFASIEKNFKTLKEDGEKFWKGFDGLAGKSLYESDRLMKLDGEKFANHLKSYDPNFAALISNYLSSALCDRSDRLSTLSAFSCIEDIFTPAYVLPGGNSAITKSLRETLSKAGSDRLVGNAFVWSIEIKDGGASVYYGKDEQITRVDCKHVIIAIPHMITSRITRGIPDKAKATMFRFKYGSYLVANLLLEKPVLKECYDYWAPTSNSVADIVVAETPYLRATDLSEPSGSVLTAYFPYPPGSEGRPLLLQGDKDTIAKNVLKELKSLVPGLGKSIEELVLTRWGHAIATTRPGYFRYIKELRGYENASFSLAHSSAHGLPCAEAAVAGAMHASARALKK